MLTRSRKRILLELLALFGVLVGCAPCAWIVIGVWHQGRYADRQRQRLLNEIDHEALLVACRELIAQRPKLGPIGQRGAQIHIDSQDPAVPEAVRCLHPTDILVGDKWMSVELLGGFDHCGFHAFAEGIPSWGDKELVPGLW